MKEATGLSDEQLVSSHKEFRDKFADGFVTYDDFRNISREVIPDDEEELARFCGDVFAMFDINDDRALNFEEFTFALSASKFADPRKKLTWLFDHVYDKVRTYVLYVLYHVRHFWAF